MDVTVATRVSTAQKNVKLVIMEGIVRIAVDIV